MKLLKELLNEKKKSNVVIPPKGKKFGKVGTKADKKEQTGGMSNFAAKHAQNKSGAGAHKDTKGKDASRTRQKANWKKDQGY